jgi:hypothetical protein
VTVVDNSDGSYTAAAQDAPRSTEDGHFARRSDSIWYCYVGYRLRSEHPGCCSRDEGHDSRGPCPFLYRDRLTIDHAVMTIPVSMRNHALPT